MPVPPLLHAGASFAALVASIERGEDCLVGNQSGKKESERCIFQKRCGWLSNTSEEMKVAINRAEFRCTVYNIFKVSKQDHERTYSCSRTAIRRHGASPRNNQLLDAQFHGTYKFFYWSINGHFVRIVDTHQILTYRFWFNRRYQFQVFSWKPKCSSGTWFFLSSTLGKWVSFFKGLKLQPSLSSTGLYGPTFPWEQLCLMTPYALSVVQP
jgi:hypothetical protein